MKKVLLAIIFVVLAIFIFSRPVDAPKTTATKPLHTITVKDIEVPVVKVTTSEEITKGLGGTTNLPENQGMLFVFPKPEHRTFWMKNMVIPIDIIWIHDNKIVQIDKDVAPPSSINISDDELKLYPSNQPVDYVLEVNSGWSDKNNVAVGDIVNLQNVK